MTTTSIMVVFQYQTKTQIYMYALTLIKNITEHLQLQLGSLHLTLGVTSTCMSSKNYILKYSIEINLVEYT